MGTWTPLPKVGRRKKYGPFYYTSWRFGHLNTTSESWKEKEVWSLLLHFLAIWALEHHFPKVEGDRSMVPSITLPGNLGNWTPLPKAERRKKYGPLYYTFWWFGHLNTTSQRWKEKEVWFLLLHFLTIWALEHHFSKFEGGRSTIDWFINDTAKNATCSPGL